MHLWDYIVEITLIRTSIMQALKRNFRHPLLIKLTCALFSSNTIFRTHISGFHCNTLLCTNQPWEYHDRFIHLLINVCVHWPIVYHVIYNLFWVLDQGSSLCTIGIVRIAERDKSKLFCQLSIVTLIRRAQKWLKGIIIVIRPSINIEQKGNGDKYLS